MTMDQRQSDLMTRFAMELAELVNEYLDKGLELEHIRYMLAAANAIEKADLS